MKKRAFTYSAAAMFAVMLVICIGSAEAFENVTAQEAYGMVNSGEAVLIDIRTIEECYWVGFPNVVPGGLYIIPWQIMTISCNGEVTTRDNLDFDDLIDQEFGDDTSQALIVMCRSGGRSSSAAERLESLGYTNVYEIDNVLKEEGSYPGGRGGFQGTSYHDAYDGYRGYPKRLPSTALAGQITVETDTDSITNPESSVSWMDTGLPMTQDLGNAIIPETGDGGNGCFVGSGATGYKSRKFGLCCIIPPYVKKRNAH